MDDLTARPLLDSVVVSATGEIERRRERFSARSLVAWQVGALGDKVELNVFADDVRSAFHIRRADIQFTKFHPEDFFVTCSNQSDRDAILRQPRLATASGRVFLFRPWDESLHGVPVRYRYRARLCIEGVPMHAHTDETAAKVIGRKCSIHYVEEYSRRGNYNRTYDMWVWTDEPRAIPRGGSFAITSADKEGLPTDIPLPELEPLRNPPPSEPKKGWSYDVLIHVDTLEDLHARKAWAYKWDYKVQDDSINFREYPLPCRAEPDPARGPDDEDEDGNDPSRGRHRSRSLWDRLSGRSHSRSRDPNRRDTQRRDQERRGRSRDRERSDHRYRGHRSREPSEVRPPLPAQTDPQLPPLIPSSAAASPCKLLSPLRNLGSDDDAASPLVCTSVAAVEILQPDEPLFSQGRVDILDILESHLDPMLHEAAVHHSIYSPDTSSPRVSSPVFVPTSTGHAGADTPSACKAMQIDSFINGLATPVQPPLLPAPDVNARKPSRAKVKIPALVSAQRHSERLLCKRRAGAKLENFAQEILSKKFGIIDESASFDDNIKKLYLQRYKKPLSPASLKIIADLVEKGGCKTIRMKNSKKNAAVAPL